MFIAIIFILLSNFLEIISNPYCQIICHHHYTGVENGFCEMTNQLILNKREEWDTSLWKMTDAVRHYILVFLNGIRNKFAKGKMDGNISKPISNMQIINYDMELEMLAQLEASMPERSSLPVPSCLRTASYFVDYIHGSYSYNSTDFMITGNLNNTIQNILNYWSYSKNYSNVPFKLETTLALVFWARLDNVGCAIFTTSTEEDPFITQLNAVCMFGSVDAPPRSAMERPFKFGRPCKKCKKDVICSSPEYRSLCGRSESLYDTHDRWQTKFWSVPAHNVKKSLVGNSSSPKLSLILLLLISYILLSIYQR